MLGEIESFMLQDKFEPRDASIVGVAAATRLTTAMTTTIAAVAFSDNQARQTHSPRAANHRSRRSHGAPSA